MLTFLSRRGADSRRWIAVLMCVVFVFASKAACAASKIVTDADKGGEVHLKMGDTLEVRLKANPSTGFMWYIQKESTPVMKLVHQTQADAAEPGVGRPVVQVFLFEPKRSGDGALRLHYVRSCEPPTPEDERFEIHVVVE